MTAKSTAVELSGRDDSTLGRAEAAMILEQFASGRPLDSKIAERNSARAAQVTAAIRRDHGLVDNDTFQSLLDDEA